MYRMKKRFINFLNRSFWFIFLNENDHWKLFEKGYNEIARLQASKENDHARKSNDWHVYHCKQFFRTIYITARRNLNNEITFPFLGIFVAIIQPLRSQDETLSVALRGKKRIFFFFFHISFFFLSFLFQHYTMVENGKKHRQNSNLINHFPTSERTSEWPSTYIWVLFYYRP